MFKKTLLTLLIMAFTGMAVFAQSSRQLQPDTEVTGVITADTLAQVYPLSAETSTLASLTLTADTPLALLITDGAGETVTQQVADADSPTLVLEDISLIGDEIYYATVFAVTAPTTPIEFSLLLTLAPSVTPTETEAAASVPTPTQAPVTTLAEFTPPSEALLSTGLNVALTWNATVDLNLEVRDPLGGTVYWDIPAAESGGFFDGFNVNGACETFTANAPTETIRWQPGVIPTGSYEILVFYVQDCAGNGAVPFNINVTAGTETLAPLQGTMLANQVYIANFEVAPDGTITLGQGGVNRNQLGIPFDQLTSNARDIALGSTAEGVIVNDQPLEVFTFEAAEGDLVSASLSANAGSLDAYLFLLDPAGNVLAQNDDATPETRNAAINSQLISAAGTYSLVATRYGQSLGGTEGSYSLSLGGGETQATLPETLTGVTVPRGIIEVSLLWENATDIQLLVRDPSGDAVFDDRPIISSGGQLLFNGNVNCTPALTTSPFSYVYWPEGQRVRPGTYEVDVWFQSNCNDVSPTNASLSVNIGGETIISDSFIPLVDDHYVTTFTINLDGSVVRGEGGITGGSESINYLAELANAPVLTSNVPVTETITQDDKFDVYTFEGSTGETISVQMNATAGTLDTLLFLISPTGVELVSNDDAVPNETTNSLIQAFALPQTGQYIVLATHYGTVYGGTEGVYTLTFTRQTP
jgi:uncharacterized protein YfaP (DUF2135 family)